MSLASNILPLILRPRHPYRRKTAPRRSPLAWKSTAEYWAGGDGDAATSRIEAVKTGYNLHKGLLSDPLEVLRCFGGRDIAGMVGAILAARHQAIPIILDGYVVCAAAAVLHNDA